MAYKNYRQVMAMQKKYKDEIKKICPEMDDASGIYFLTRTDEDGINYFYVGQAVKLLSRMASHMTGYQHIDLSLKKRKFYSEQNPYGWKLNFIHYPTKDLDKMEQYWILEYTKKGYQARYNKTSGSQGVGKSKINEYKAARGYHQGLHQGYKNASRDIAHLFDLHLDYTTKNNPPTRNQQKAVAKFEDFLNEYKMPEDTGQIDTERLEKEKYGKTIG